MGALILKERRQSLARRISSCVFGIVASLRVPGASRQANAGQKASQDILYRSLRHSQTGGNPVTRNTSDTNCWRKPYLDPRLRENDVRVIYPASRALIFAAQVCPVSTRGRIRLALS